MRRHHLCVVTTLLELLGAAAAPVPLSVPVRELLAALVVDPTTLAEWTDGGAGAQQGDVTGHIDRVLCGMFHLDLAPGGPSVPFHLKPLASPDGFQIDLLISRVEPLAAVFGLSDPSGLLRPGIYHSSPPDGPGQWPAEWLEPTAGAVTLAADLAVRIRGTATEPAELRLVPSTGSDQQDGIVSISPQPASVCFGDTGFGIDLANGFVVDDSTTVSDGPAAADWTGVALRSARLFIPRGVPLIGGIAVPVSFALGQPGGLEATTSFQLAASGRRPAIDVRLEWHDPAASVLTDALPTLLDLTTTLPVRGSDSGDVPGGGSVTFGGGAPLILHARFTRDLRVTPPRMNVAVSVEGAGEDGLVRVDGSSGPGKVFVTAAALATALVADSQLEHPPPSGDASGVWLHALLVAATGASAFLDNAGKLIVHGATLEGETSAADTSLRMRLDYSVDVVTRFDAGVLRVCVDPNQPMRIRYRDVMLAVDLDQPGLSGLNLSFAQASMELEDPGLWTVHSPGSLLDVLGTRSGHGSLWFEVDLGFALDLGPITVSNATIRVTDEGGSLSLELRGLGVQVAAGPFNGQGIARLTGDGFSAMLNAQLGDPLGLTARAWLSYTGDASIAVGLEGSLPGPIPLGPTGLGLYTVGGIFGINARPVLPGPDGGDLVDRQLHWKPDGGFGPDTGSMMFGVSVAIGTLYDWGFSLYGAGQLILTVPDPTLRVAVKAWLLTPSHPGLDQPSLLTGVLVVDGDGVTLGLRGHFKLPHLLCLDLPVDGRWPFTDSADWYLHLGSDGYPTRPPGPIQAHLLPDLFDVGGFAYLMVRGGGIDHLGNIDPDISLGGAAMGFGLGVNLDFGARPICWMRLSARARAGLGTDPWFLSAAGTIDGSLHLGPFSIGAHADLAVRVGPGEAFWAAFRVCASIDLWITEIEGCVHFELPPGAPQPTVVPEPAEWPLKAVSLSDRRYVEVGQATADSASAPVVWPDIVPILQFSLGPTDSSVATPFDFVDSGNAGDGRTGNDKLRYDYTLDSLHLYTADGTEVTGPLEAAWQQPKHALGPSSTGGSGARELALLTFRTDLWATRRSDGGAGHPADPVPPVATGCFDSPAASAGWALGARAVVAGTGWQLRPDIIRTDAFTSTFTVEVDLRWAEGVPLTEASALAILGPPVGFAHGRVMPWTKPEQLAFPSPPFAGVLRLPAFTTPYPPGQAAQTGLIGRFGDATVTLTPSEPLRDPVLWVTLPEAAAPYVDQVLVTDPDTGQHWSVFDNERIDAAGSIAFGFSPGPQDVTIERLEVRFPPTHGLSLLGLRGTSTTVIAAAAGAGDRRRHAIDVLHTKRALRPGDRTPLRLRPDTLYRLSVGLRVTGTLDDGTTATFPPDKPKEFDYWFRTATAVPAAATPPLGTAGVDPVLWHRFAAQQTFDSSYLDRYLIGYQPADRTINWYLDDAPAANFGVDYIASLADLYGYGIGLAIRRTDGPPQPPGSHPVGWRPIMATLVDLLDPSGLPRLDQRYAELGTAMTCPLPPAGASLQGPAGLAPQATYELAVVFPLLHAGPAPAAPLPSVVFTTSRYHCPADQLAAAGFGPVGGLAGDLKVEPGADAGLADGRTVSDVAFGTVLSRLGLDALPLPESGRASALWIPHGAGWALAGVLIESPEPLNRPGRVELGALNLADWPFPVVVSDASGARLLFLTRKPTTPGSAATLRLDVRGTGVPSAVQCGVAAVPAFAEELV
jgi:hypothetical protein